MHRCLAGLGTVVLAVIARASDSPPAPAPEQHAPTHKLAPVELAARCVRVPILMYHQIRELDRDTERLALRFSVSPAALDAQMRWLKEHGYTTITLDQVVGALSDPPSKPPLPERPIVITIDDGWTNGYSLVLPMLQKYGMTATYFIFPNVISEQTPGQYMSWPQVRDLAAKGMSIGSHTLSHPHLPTLSSDAARAEITESRTRIEAAIGKPVTSLAYPFGEFTSEHVRMAREAGYAVAVSTEPGIDQKCGEELVLRRTIITYFDSIDDFAAKVKGELIPGGSDPRPGLPAAHTPPELPAPDPSAPTVPTTAPPPPKPTP